MSSYSCCSSLSFVTSCINRLSDFLRRQHQNFEISKIKDSRSLTSAISRVLCTSSNISPIIAMRRFNRTNGRSIETITNQVLSPCVETSSASAKSPYANLYDAYQFLIKSSWGLKAFRLTVHWMINTKNMLKKGNVLYMIIRIICIKYRVPEYHLKKPITRVQLNRLANASTDRLSSSEVSVLSMHRYTIVRLFASRSK